MSNWDWIILIIIHAIATIIVSIIALKKAERESYVAGYEQCIADSCRHIMSTKVNKENISYEKAIDCFGEWMNKGFPENNDFDIHWGTYLVNGDRTVLYVKAFGHTICEVKEIKDGDMVDE